MLQNRTKDQQIPIHDRILILTAAEPKSKTSLSSLSHYAPASIVTPQYVLLPKNTEPGFLPTSTSPGHSTASFSVGMQPAAVPCTPITYFQPHGTQPYLLKMLTKQILVCAGRRLGYNDEKTIPLSPYNTCIVHEESRQVTPTTGSL